MVRSTPSVCSNPTRKRSGGPAVTAALLLAGFPMAVAGPAQAEPAWRQGVFPVASFAGYTSHFGHRVGPAGSPELHQGLDIAAPLGSPIRNWWGGRVQRLIDDGACGLGVVIASGPYEHLYCHLAGSMEGGTYRSGAVRLAPGQRLRAGALVGHVGLSGRTNGPHLHWGIRYRGTWLNPASVLRAMAASRR